MNTSVHSAGRESVWQLSPRQPVMPLRPVACPLQLSVVSVSMLALNGVADVTAATAWGLVQAIVPALLMNVCIVGFNQISDIEIDKARAAASFSRCAPPHALPLRLQEPRARSFPPPNSPCADQQAVPAARERRVLRWHGLGARARDRRRRAGHGPRHRKRPAAAHAGWQARLPASA